VLPAFAQQGAADVNLAAPVQYSKEWKPHPELWRSLLNEKREVPTIKLGRGEFQMRGPLVEMFRAPRVAGADDSLEMKLRRIPILNLVIPYRMAMPPEGRSRYFAWGESARPWRAIAEGGAPGAGGFATAVSHRSEGSLLSIDR
jgi:hypothetical protein